MASAKLRHTERFTSIPAFKIRLAGKSVNRSGSNCLGRDRSAAKLADMRAEAVSWDDWSVQNQPPIADNDKWHVQLAADDVKVVTLEQLDDLFRLSLVDSETNVWQTGMTEWQPLRIIAGLDEQPAPAPKRAPPKPPTRTVVMAPSVATPSVRPPAPAPRPATPSVRPAPPPARTASLAPASFYPEPVQARSPAYAQTVAYAAPLSFPAPAPVATTAMNSVRPLVVSHAPPPSARRGGGGFGRFLVFVALLAGVSVTAYRNDFLRDAAHQAHQDALYTRLEAALGGPAFGTLRALEESAAAQPTADLASSEAAPIRTAITPSPEAPTPTPTTGTSTPPVISLESLGTEQKAQTAAKSLAAAMTPAAVAPTPAPVRAAASFVPPKPVAAPAPAKPASVKAAAQPKPAVEKPEPVATKPLSEMSERERLNAAIGQSMMESALPKAKGKKAKSKGNEYDPLNPNL